MSSGGPHGDKWVAVKVSGLTGDEQAAALSAAAQAGFYQTPVATTATDGNFVLVSNYEKGHGNS